MAAPMAERKYLYRAEATYDEGGAGVTFKKFLVYGETPHFYKVIPESKSYLIEIAKSVTKGSYTHQQLKKHTRRVGKYSERRYCHESIELAIHSLYRRRQRQLTLAEIESGLSRAVMQAIKPMMMDDSLMPKSPTYIKCGMFPELDLVRFD